MRRSRASWFGRHGTGTKPRSDHHAPDGRAACAGLVTPLCDDPRGRVHAGSASAAASAYPPGPPDQADHRATTDLGARPIEGRTGAEHLCRSGEAECPDSADCPTPRAGHRGPGILSVRCSFAALSHDRRLPLNRGSTTSSPPPAALVTGPQPSRPPARDRRFRPPDAKSSGRSPPSADRNLHLFSRGRPLRRICGDVAEWSKAHPC